MWSLSGIPIVGKALDEISQAVIDSVKRDFGYLYNYKDNVKKLEAKIEELGVVEQRLASKVESDKDAGKKMESHVESNVKKWQDEVKRVKGEGEEILQRYKDMMPWRCFSVLWVPNLCSRFQLGREAVKNTDKATGLIIHGNVFINGEIAFLPRFEFPNDPSSDPDYVHFGSRKEAFDDIWEALNRQDGSPVIGIFGMPGVGKTKLMEQVSKRAKEKKTFDEIARANVGAVVDIQSIQGQLASWLNSSEISKEPNEDKRAFLLANRLKNEKKILVILDDVWNEIPLEKIGIPYGDGSIKGCKILLTSRKKDFCLRNNCEDRTLFEIKSLEAEEAWHLFEKNVGGSTLENLNNGPLAENVCKECACLPLVISAVGKALKCKPKVSWEAALCKFKNCCLEEIAGIDPKVYAGLEFSFNQLQDDAKTCLLLCSLSDEDAEIEIEHLFRLAKGTGLLKNWDTFEEERSHVGSIVVELKLSSLLLEGQRDTVKLHDTIRDVARSIAFKDDSYAFLSKRCGSSWRRQDNYSPRKLIDLSFKSVNEFPLIEVFMIANNLMCEQLHTLRLRSQNFLHLLDLPDSFFNGFKNLRLLSLSFSPLPSSLGNLINLRMLDLHGCDIKEISLIILLKNIEMLVLHECSLPEPLDLGGLKRLRMLDLADCYNVVMLRHALSSLRKLEELLLPYIFRIWDTEANEEVSILPELSKLTLLTNLQIHLKDSMSCPDRNFCKKLARFKISVAAAFPSSLTRFKRSLRFLSTSIKGAVKSLVERAEEVEFESVTDFENCFSNNSGEAFVDLTSLKIEFVDDAERLAKFPQNDIRCYQSRPFSRLCELDIRDSGFKYLLCASSARCLVQLQTLTIHDCEMIEEIVRNEKSIEEDDEIIEFPKLRSIVLDGLPSIRSFYSRSRNMSIIEENTAHESLFDGMVAFPSLRILRISEVHINVQSLFTCAFVRILQQLEELEVRSCESMEEICTDLWEDEVGGTSEKEIISFPRLKFIVLHELPNLKSFSRSTKYAFNMPSLERVELLQCTQLQNFTSLQCTTPSIEVTTCLYSGKTTKDLNNYIHQLTNTL